jgi:glutathione S-transferase
MPILHHLPLSPFCRKVRVTLGEKGLPIDLKDERVWERNNAFLTINPAGKVPTLEMEDGAVVADSYAIVEFIEEMAPTPPLLGSTPGERAETRRLSAWFDDKFFNEVTKPLYGEKVLKRLAGDGAPDSGALRAGRANLSQHLEYIAWLCDRRTWLAGDHFTLADITAGAHLSVLDFLGDVPWDRFDGAKLWYQRIKSRPSFRPLLADRVTGFQPPAHYANLDF